MVRAQKPKSILDYFQHPTPENEALILSDRLQQPHDEIILLQAAESGDLPLTGYLSKLA